MMGGIRVPQAGRINLVREFLFWTAVIILALMLGAYLPFAGVVIFAVITFPLVLFSIRHDTLAGVLLLGAVTGLSVFIFGKFEGLFFLCEFGALSQVLAYGIRHNLSHEKTIFSSFLIIIVTMSVWLVSINTQIKDGNLNDYIKKEITENFNQSIEVYNKLEIKREQKEVFKKVAQTTRNYLVKTYWGIYAGFTLLMIVLNLFVCERLLALLGFPITLAIPFYSLKLSEHFIWGFIISAGMVAVNILSLVKREVLYLAGLNLLIVFLTLYFIQGLAISNFWWKKIHPPVSLLFLMFFLMMVYPSLFLIILTGGGLSDTWFDLRKAAPGLQ